MIAAGVAGSVLVAAGAVALVRSALRERYVERMAAESHLVADWIARRDAGDSLQAIAEAAARRLGVRVTLIDVAGEVLADSSREAGRVPQMENHLHRHEINQARQVGWGVDIRTSRSTNVEYLYGALLAQGTEPVRYVRLALPTESVHTIRTKYVSLIVVVVIATMVVLVAVGYAAVRRLSHPVERMAEEVARSVESEFALPLSAMNVGGDEIRRLAATVKRMQVAMLEKIGELDGERRLLASVVSGMREGLLLVGPDRHVRLANDALRRLLELEIEPRGRPLEEVVRHPEVIRVVNTALDGAEVTGDQVLRLPGSDRSFQLHAAPLEGTSRSEQFEALVLFFDITRVERLEAMRRDFVANVSHELRTPLTSIKAFVENLLDGGIDEPQNARRFLEIVSRHADRMGELIEDLTDLSQIETGAVQLERRRVDAADVSREVVDQLRALTTVNEVQVDVGFDGPFVILADRRRLEQMLTNLVGNAIKFNRKGGSVVVRGEKTAEHSTIHVEDTGVGIPADSLEKVFQRFHRVDRNRSREVGGTGLGLSIVKHLMRLHGGRVRVDSELGRGSTFSLDFPDVEPPAEQSTV